MGTTIGGWLTIRYRPSTSSPSFDNACRLSWVRAFAAPLRMVFSSCLAVLACFLEALAAARRSVCSSSSSSRRAYQMSIVPIWAKLAIDSR